MNHISRIAPVVLLAALASVATPAQAKDGEVIRKGSCSASADWKLKASPDDGRIEVEAEVDSNKKGQTWEWRLVHNGSVTARGTATTAGPSGSFDVERAVVNVKGEDSLKLRAHNAASDETCKGALTF
jgi:hypothetical protein